MSSKIQVDSIQGLDPAESPVTFPLGATIPSGQILSSTSMSVDGTLTATTFVGNGDNLTGVTFATVSKTFAFSLLAG